MFTTSEWKGNPTVVVSQAGGRSFTFGKAKIGAILANLDQVRAWYEAETASETMDTITCHECGEPWMWASDMPEMPYKPSTPEETLCNACKDANVELVGRYPLAGVELPDMSVPQLPEISEHTRRQAERSASRECARAKGRSIARGEHVTKLNAPNRWDPREAIALPATMTTTPSKPRLDDHATCTILVHDVKSNDPHFEQFEKTYGQKYAVKTRGTTRIDRKPYVCYEITASETIVKSAFKFWPKGEAFLSTTPFDMLRDLRKRGKVGHFTHAGQLVEKAFGRKAEDIRLLEDVTHEDYVANDPFYQVMANMHNVTTKDVVEGWCRCEICREKYIPKNGPNYNPNTCPKCTEPRKKSGLQLAAGTMGPNLSKSRQASMFSDKETAGRKHQGNSALIEHGQPLELKVQDPRTPEQKEQDQRKAEAELNYSLPGIDPN